LSILFLYVLEELEWHDLERTVADIFDGLGFLVTLTPPRKDGGKDIILDQLSRSNPPARKR
jgi:sulfur transfer protein SufE